MECVHPQRKELYWSEGTIAELLLRKNVLHCLVGRDGS